MNKDCKKFYQEISKACEITSLKDGVHPIRMNQILKHDEKLHLSFETKSTTAVKKIHELALIYGGISDGEPKVRSFNGRFSAYIIDPAGNRLEVSCAKRA